MAETYSLGSIPPLSVWKGEDLNVLLQSNLGAGVTFSLSVESPQPKGNVSLDASTGVLKYTPAAEDTQRITAVVRARKDSKSEEQKVLIFPAVPSDFNVVQHRSTDKTAPNPEGWQYITFAEEQAENE